MYVPRHFALDADRVADLLASAQTAQLVTAHADGPVASLLPVLHRPGDGWGSLVFHVTRTNGQWKDTGLGAALAILSGPDGYIDPDWYPSQAHKHSVPTWNYVTVHAYGELIVHDDPAWKRAAVAELGERHGYASALSEDDWERQLRPIVGLELPIARVEAKAKLNQNRAPSDIAGAIEGLRGVGAHDLADAMDALAMPHARARFALLDEIGRRVPGGPRGRPVSRHGPGAGRVQR